MAVERIGGPDCTNKEELLDISVSEIINIDKRIVNSYNKYLAKYGVKKLWTDKHEMDINNSVSDEELIKQLSAKQLQLIFLYKYKRKLVHKDLVSEFVRKYIPNAAADQQVRHLGTQLHWNVLNKGCNIPDEDMKVPSGYNYLVSLEQPNPTLLIDEMKRKGRLAARDFDDLKIVYNNCCATCGRKEGSIDERNGNTEIILQQGHMDPSKKLDLDNTIPQCQYCNQAYGDDFCFNVYGRVIAVYNPRIVLKSPKNIQDEMITILQEERARRK